jgi:hypothetical protein
MMAPVSLAVSRMAGSPLDAAWLWLPWSVPTLNIPKAMSFRLNLLVIHCFM